MLRWPWLVELLRERTSRRMVTVSGTVVEIDPDDQDYSGVKHQIFVIRVGDVDAGEDEGVVSGDQLLVSVRYGDPSGLPRPIADIAADEPIEVRGDYIPPEEARSDADEERLGVLHFTHRPLGWVKYQGRTYR